MPSASVSGGPDPPPKRRPNRWIQRFCWSQWDGAGWCGGLYGRPRHPCPVTRSHSSSAVSTLQRNHKSIEFGASIMSCEYLAGLGEKSMAIVEGLRVQECHFAPGGFGAADFKRMAETGCAIQGSGEESICCRPVVAGR